MGRPPRWTGVCPAVFVYFSTRCAAKSWVSAATRGDLPGTRLKRGQERLDGDVEGKIVEFFTGRRLEMHFVGRARARDKQVAPADLPRDPRPAHVAFPELRHPPEVAGNVGFWGGGHEKTI